MVEPLVDDDLGTNLIALNISEIIFTLAHQSFLAADGHNTAVLAGFANPQITLALTAIHKAPGDSGTLERLAETIERAGCRSQAAFSRVFKKKHH
ncbi:MAG: hypothetical protein ACR2PF_15580 [Rhizobiaceae bacterium]